jgi:hypothetical protein
MKRSKRTVMARIMLSPEEKKIFWKLAEDQGTDFSELARRLLHKELQQSSREKVA